MSMFPLKKKKKNFIQGMHLKKGAFTAKAEKAGMGVQEFAAHVLANKGKYDSTTVKEAVLARTFKKISKKK